MFATFLVLALAAPPDARAAVAVAAASFNPAGSPGPVPVERWEPDPRHAHINRVVGGSIVGAWFPRWECYVDYDEAEKRWGHSHDGPMPPGTVKQSLTVVPPGHHAHVTTDGRYLIHGDWNMGDPIAHQGIARPWPKVAFPGQSVPGFCPPGRQ